MIRALLLLAIAGLLSGCELIAAGIIGAEVERQHREWCASIHNYDRSCWQVKR